MYAKATKQASDLDERSKISTSFDYLLRQVAPRLVIVHGKDAAELLHEKDLPCELVCVKHFRFWSKRNARELGLRIRRYCEGEYPDRAGKPPSGSQPIRIAGLTSKAACRATPGGHLA